jgi:hypothetical protein
MKKLFIILLLTCGSAFAQIDIGKPGVDPINKADEAKLRIAGRNVEYNASIVAFAQLCGANPDDYKKIEALLFKNLNTVGLNHSQIDDMRVKFNNAIASTKEKNKNISKNECSLFNNEYIKIISAINGSAVTVKNN